MSYIQHLNELIWCKSIQIDWVLKLIDLWFEKQIKQEKVRYCNIRQCSREIRIRRYNAVHISSLYNVLQSLVCLACDYYFYHIRDIICRFTINGKVGKIWGNKPSNDGHRRDHCWISKSCLCHCIRNRCVCDRIVVVYELHTESERNTSNSVYSFRMYDLETCVERVCKSCYDVKR